jgi:hypothetical protein
MSREKLQERPPVVVFTGFGVSGAVLDERFTHRISPTEHFDIFVRTGWWPKKSTESPERVISRARDVLEEVAEQVGRPIGAIGLSASAALPIAAARGLDVVRGIVALSGPVNPRAELDTRGVKRLGKIRRDAPGFIKFLDHFADKVLPNLPQAEKDRILAMRGTFDANVPESVSVFPGAAQNGQVRTRRLPLHDARHIYNLATGLKSGTVKQFLMERLAS